MSDKFTKARSKTKEKLATHEDLAERARSLVEQWKGLTDEEHLQWCIGQLTLSLMRSDERREMYWEKTEEALGREDMEAAASWTNVYLENSRVRFDVTEPTLSRLPAAQLRAKPPETAADQMESLTELVMVMLERKPRITKKTLQEWMLRETDIRLSDPQIRSLMSCARERGKIPARGAGRPRKKPQRIIG